MKKKKFNLLSIISLGISVVSPLVNHQLAPLGIEISPVGMGMIMMPVFLLQLIQPIFILIGAVTANGAFSVGAKHMPTNIAGIVGAIFSLTAIFGFHASAEVQTAIGGIFSKLIAYYSISPEGAKALQEQ